MKKMIITLLISMFALQANAEQKYLCFDSKTGKDAGNLTEVGNGQVMYSSLSTSSNGWLLTITEDGKLYNADPMVKHGKDFYVGEVQYENFKLLVTINTRNMYCF